MNVMTKQATALVPFAEAATPETLTIWDEWMAANTEHNIMIPAGGFLRSLTVACDPDAITRTAFTQPDGWEIYRIDGGHQSARMYPRDNGYSIPFEWAADGRGSLENKNAHSPYRLFLRSSGAQQVTVTAHSWAAPPAFTINGDLANQAPPYPGSILTHKQFTFTNPGNWGIGAEYPLFPRGSREFLHRYWVSDDGTRVTVAKEYRA
jgi:hypothetical protein